MSTKPHYLRTGLFVLVGALLFIGALFAVGLRSYFGERDRFETFVPGKVEDLTVGALVKLRGVTIGKVSSIDFAGSEYPGFGDQYVLIHFTVARGTAWSGESHEIQPLLNREAARGLRARVQGQGFLGAKILSLEYVDPKMYPADPAPWTPKHYYIPSAPSQFDRLFTSLEKSLYHIEDVDFEALLNRAQKLLDTGQRLADNLNRVDFDQIGTNAGSLIVEFRETNRGLQRTLADAQRTLVDAQRAINGADLAAISRQTTDLESKLSSAAVQLRQLLGSVDMGELNSSLANVRAATDELTSLLHELAQRPSSVIFSKYPPPSSTMEKPTRP
jgi:phospholipid/cholesterol/gamma-HCH transport system substrate-binding protein